MRNVLLKQRAYEQTDRADIRVQCWHEVRWWNAQLSPNTVLAALTWNTTYLAPSIWVSPLPPDTEVLPELPPLDGSPTNVGFREVDLLGGGGVSAARKPQAVHGTRDFVRGSLASVPFKPGECDLSRYATQLCAMYRQRATYQKMSAHDE